MNYSAFYARNAEAFLAARRLSFDDLDGVVRRQFDDAKYTLLTSSAVHGVANAASDIDLICITKGGRSDNAMASQIHHNGHHMEVVAFSDAEVDDARATLQAHAQSTASSQLSLYRSWDKHHPISRKYLERIIAGVATDRSVPFVDAQNGLGAIWSVAHFDAFRQSVGFAMLALKCEEGRAAAGYATNALLYLMNAMLSQRCWTVSNKKWTLLRWHHACDTLDLWGSVKNAETASLVDALWRQVYPACATGLTASLAEALLELVDKFELFFGYTEDYKSCRPSIHREGSTPFLPGSDFVIARNGYATLQSARCAIPDHLSIRPRDLDTLSPDIAHFLLSGARSGLIGFSLADTLIPSGAVAA